MTTITGILDVAVAFLLAMWIIRATKKKPKTGLSIKCECGNELTKGNSFISDNGHGDDNHVKYLCEQCGKKYDFNFDIAPVPLPWSELTPKKDVTKKWGTDEN